MERGRWEEWDRARGRRWTDQNYASFRFPPRREKPVQQAHTQAEEYTTAEDAAAKKASRSFKKYTYRGVELDQLLDLSNEAFIDVS